MLLHRRLIAMMKIVFLSVFVFVLLGCSRRNAGSSAGSDDADLFRWRSDQTRWASFENPGGEKGRGGLENQGAKGDPAQEIKPGESKVLMDIKGCGVIRRIWMTIYDKSPKMLRGMRLDITWDGAATPAVSAPLGSFFGHCGAGMSAFESGLFSSPEARSFNCIIPMPFRKSARVVVTNETDAVQRFLFYDIDYILTRALPDDAMYFHAHWRRENPTTLGRDFEILPLVRGKGRFLGSNVTVAAVNRFEVGVEGAVKIYLDGDRSNPTLVGTGTEDYIGNGWGSRVFAHRWQGCLAAEREILAFYRYHVSDPVFFQDDCRVTIQQMTGGDKAAIAEMVRAGVPLRIVGGSLGKGRITGFLDTKPNMTIAEAPDGFLMVYTCFDVSATAYFYLDRPESGLPPLASCAERSGQ